MCVINNLPHTYLPYQSVFAAFRSIMNRSMSAYFMPCSRLVMVKINFGYSVALDLIPNQFKTLFMVEAGPRIGVGRRLCPILKKNSEIGST